MVSVFLLLIVLLFLRMQPFKENPVNDGKFWDHESLLYERDTLDSI